MSKFEKPCPAPLQEKIIDALAGFPIFTIRDRITDEVRGHVEKIVKGMYIHVLTGQLSGLDVLNTFCEAFGIDRVEK